MRNPTTSSMYIKAPAVKIAEQTQPIIPTNRINFVGFALGKDEGKESAKKSPKLERLNTIIEAIIAPSAPVPSLTTNMEMKRTNETATFITAPPKEKAPPILYELMRDE